MIDVYLESNPGVSLAPNLFTVEAYDENLNASSYGGNINDVRMIIITLNNNVTEAVNVSVRANYLWNGNSFSDTQYVFNNTFATGYLQMTP